MNVVSKSLFLALIGVGLHAQTIAPTKNAKPTPARLVVVGDSLSAGVQNFSLWHKQQGHGYASIVAKQAGWPLTLPLVPDPGAPNHLELLSLQPLQIGQAPGELPPVPRLNPLVEPTNIAVPGLTVETALTLRPTLTPASNAPPEQGWATIVLGFPNLYNGWAPTEVELAKALNPDVLIEWLGNNDALVPALTGQVQTLTPVDKFAASYAEILGKLSAKHRKLITATIPDVTETAFFASVQQIAHQANDAPPAYIAQRLGIGLNDYVRLSGQALVQSILSDPNAGPLPTDCPALLPDLGVSTLPCVLKDADAKKIRATINCYNAIIKATTFFYGGIVVDINRLVNQIYVNGKTVAGTQLTTNYLGGLFSLDGIHPTDTGYGIIANEFIQTMNAGWKMNIPPADLTAIFNADPLKDDILPGGKPAGALPAGEGAYCFAY